MEKPTMFIGSSSEGLDTAGAIKKHFDAEMGVTLWKEGVFELNVSSLESLLRASLFFDFAILVATADDVTKSRGKTKSSPRDNVIFENGLFLGRIGPRRAFIVCEEGTKILSDYAGITVATYRKGSRSSLVAACEQIRAAIEKAVQYPEIGVLPSTALAVGYFENFITKVVPALGDKRELTMKRKQKDAEGVEKEERCNLSYESFILHIVVPNNLSEVTKGSLQLSVKNLLHIAIVTPFRDFPFYIRAKDYNPERKAELSVFDIPTTLFASRRAIKLILGDHSVGLSADQEKLELREIGNFKLALRKLIDEEYGENNPYVKIETTDYLTSL